MKKILLGALAIGAVGAMAAPANATPLTGAFTATVWYGSNPSGLSTDPREQALPSNPTNTLGDLLASFTYTGALNLVSPGPGQGNIATFLATAGGSLSAFTAGSSGALNHILSTGNFADVTLMEFTFTTAQTISGTITHDDGISIFQGNTPILTGASAPTSATPTAYSLSPGTYNLWYAEVNALPAVLDFDVASSIPAPEPMSMAILGTGIVGLGMVMRRRRSS
jgi:hypothetical protein